MHPWQPNQQVAPLTHLGALSCLVSLLFSAADGKVKEVIKVHVIGCTPSTRRSTTTGTLGVASLATPGDHVELLNTN